MGGKIELVTADSLAAPRKGERAGSLSFSLPPPAPIRNGGWTTTKESTDLMAASAAALESGLRPIIIKLCDTSVTKFAAGLEEVFVHLGQKQRLAIISYFKSYQE